MGKTELTKITKKLIAAAEAGDSATTQKLLGDFLKVGEIDKDYTAVAGSNFIPTSDATQALRRPPPSSRRWALSLSHCTSRPTSELFRSDDLTAHSTAPPQTSDLVACEPHRCDGRAIHATYPAAGVCTMHGTLLDPFQRGWQQGLSRGSSVGV